MFTHRVAFHKCVKPPHECEQMRRSEEDLRQSIVLLSRATRQVARVQPVGDAAKTDGAGALVEIKGDSGRSARLHLIPWDEAPSAVMPRSRIWVLRRGDRKLRQQLRECDENFVDPAGAVRLHLPWLVIDRTDLEPVRTPARKETRNPFSDRASLILRTMFDAGPEKVWSVGELAEAAGVSLGLVSYVSSALERRRLIKVQAAGRAKGLRLTDPVAVVEQWTRAYDWKTNTAVAFHAPVGSPQRFLRRLPEVLEDHRWALTLQAGASLVAPHAAWDLVHLYVDAKSDDGLLEIGQQQGWEPGEGGKVVLMAPFYKTSVWHGSRRIRDLPVVSDLQLILDLWHYPIRGREQAEHLMSMALMPERQHD